MPEEGLELLDLWSGGRFRVRERLGTRYLVQWDFIAARLMEVEAGLNVIEGRLYLYPARAKEAILSELRKHHRKFARKSPGVDDAVFFKRAGMFFQHFWLDHVVFAPRPRLVTSEGDPLVFSKTVFDVLDSAALRQALDTHPQIEQEEDGAYVWFEETPDLRRILGSLRFEDARLILETKSRERAKRGSEMLKTAVGSALRHRATRHEDAAQALDRLRSSPRPEVEAERNDDIPPEVEARLMGEFLDSHYRSWVDEPIPALGGRTPRHAARLKTVRPKLIDLLKDIENTEARAAHKDRQAYDFGWLWTELGLERPS